MDALLNKVGVLHSADLLDRFPCESVSVISVLEGRPEMLFAAFVTR